MINVLASFQTAYCADIVCAVILLVSAFVAAKKGFVKCFFGFISTLVALILAIALASVVLGLFDSLFGMTESFSGKFEGWFLKRKGFDADISGSGLAEALENVALPGFLKDVVLDKVSQINDFPAGTTLASQVAPVAAQYLGLLISAVAIFIVAKLVLFIIERILTKIVQSWSVASALNGLLGFVVGALKALIFICVVLAIVSLIPSEGLVSFFDKTLVVKYLYHDNPLPKIWAAFVGSI